MTTTDAALLLLVTAGAASGTWLYLQWLDAEHRRHPADRSMPARAIIGTWDSIRGGLEWGLSKTRMGEK